MLGQVDITRRYASVDRRRFSAIDRMLPIIITGDCTHKSPLGMGWIFDIFEKIRIYILNLDANVQATKMVPSNLEEQVVVQGS